MYVVLTDDALKESRSDKAKRPLTLYRFHTDRTDALEPVVPLPYASFRTDGDYLYYNETRERDNWLAWSGINGRLRMIPWSVFGIQCFLFSRVANHFYALRPPPFALYSITLRQAAWRKLRNRDQKSSRR